MGSLAAGTNELLATSAIRLGYSVWAVVAWYTAHDVE
jgi:hypothetical protein